MLFNEYKAISINEDSEEEEVDDEVMDPLEDEITRIKNRHR